MPNRFYAIDRPKRSVKLPDVLSKEVVISIIGAIDNIKHRSIVSLQYSSGLRRSELIGLKLKDIDGSRMMIHVRGGKVGKDHYTLLSVTVIRDLRSY